MVSLATAWTYVKKYWSLLTVIIAAIVAIVFFRKQGTDLADNIKKIQGIHDEELRKIQEARTLERRQHEENQQKLKLTLDAVQKNYADAKKDLDDKKQAQIEELVKKYKNDPDELAKKLSEVTGFVIIMPD